jgi:hypothetical protein
MLLLLLLVLMLVLVLVLVLVLLCSKIVLQEQARTFWRGGRSLWLRISHL